MVDTGDIFRTMSIGPHFTMLNCDCRILIHPPSLGMANGCDGCLNLKGMGTNMMVEYNIGGGEKAPDLIETDNNGLEWIADMLEEFYTNPDFGPENAKLETSFKESGKSRADLWAFATLMAAKFSIQQNNLACDNEGKSDDQCTDNARKLYDNCKIQIPRNFKFKTGRKDCLPNPDLSKDYLTERPELHPHLHGNGVDTIDYYKTNFGLDAKLAIALHGGAHSLGTLINHVDTISGPHWMHWGIGDALGTHSGRTVGAFGTHCERIGDSRRSVGKKGTHWERIGNALGTQC